MVQGVALRLHNFLHRISKRMFYEKQQNAQENEMSPATANSAN